MLAEVEAAILSYPEAAVYLGVSRSTLARLVGQAALPVVRLTPGPRGRRGFRVSDLEAYIHPDEADQPEPEPLTNRDQALRDVAAFLVSSLSDQTLDTFVAMLTDLRGR